MKLKTKILAAAIVLGGVAAAPAANAAVYYGYVTSNYMNLRAGPDVRYPVVARIPARARLQVQGCVSGWSWCDVSYKGARGWVSGQYLQLDNHGRRAYVRTSGVTVGVPIIQFLFGNYWDTYYRNQPFYVQRDQYHRVYDPGWRGDNNRNDRDRGHDNDHGNNHWNNGRWNNNNNHRWND